MSLGVQTRRRASVRLALLLAIALEAMSVGAASAGNLYVSPAGVGVGSIADPSSLPAALSAAATRSDDTMIFLQQGVYDAQGVMGFELGVVGNAVARSITLSGGWNASYVEQLVDPESTMLDGKTTTQILNVLVDGGTAPLDVHLERLAFENGYVSGDSGAGIKAAMSAVDGGLLRLHVRHCVLKNDHARRLPTPPNTGGHGGGIYTVVPTDIADTRFESNSSDYHGGALMAHYLPPFSSAATPVSVDASTFVGNYNVGCCPNGSAIASYVNLTVTGSHFEGQSGAGSPINTNGPDAHLDVVGSSFVGNLITYWGSAIQFWNTGGTIASCLFLNNRAGHGSDGYGAITYYNAAGDPEDVTVTNCTFAGNRSLTSEDGIGGAIHSRGANLTLANDIVWDNGPLGLYSQGGDATISDSDVQNGLGSTGFADGGGNLSYDPQFVGGGDYRLSAGSLCVDGGDNEAPGLPSTDLDGNARILNGHGGGDLVVDMGAYELATYAMTPSAGTIGTRLAIVGEGYGQKKPAVYLRYESKPGVFKKVAVKIDRAASYDTAIPGLWTKKMPGGTYELWVQPKVKGAAPIILGHFTVMPPVVGDAPGTGAIGDAIAVTGAYFTSKKPKVVLVHSVTMKKKSCKVTTWTMDPTSGESSLHFVVPKVAAGTYILTVSTRIGTSTPESFEVVQN